MNYVVIKVDGKRVFEHRVVMEKKLGRKLSRHECVHHKNGNREDNRLLNLEVISRSEHAKRHFLNGDLKGLGKATSSAYKKSHIPWNAGTRKKCKICREPQTARLLCHNHYQEKFWRKWYKRKKPGAA